MYNLGFDIGGTKCAVILGNVTDSCEIGDIIVEKRVFPTDSARGPYAVTDELFATAEAILDGRSLTAKDVSAIGISCGGPLDAKKGLIQSPPNLPGWDDIPIVEMTERRFGVRTVLQNDANACAVAEWRFGAGRGKKNMVFLTFGTGMGAGLILDGKLYSGTNDLAGEVGHMRLAEDGPEGYGKRGSFEGFCSGGGIARLGERMLLQAKENGVPTALEKEEKLTAKTIALAAKAGDAVAKAVYNESARRLGQGLSLLIDLLNPEAIVIGSIYARDTALFRDTVLDVIKKETLPLAGSVCEILPAALSENIGDIAALSLVMGGNL